MSLCGVSICKCKAKNFGVCGRHSGYSYTTSNPQFWIDVQEYEDLTLSFENEDKNLQKQGLNLLGVQSYYNNNLCGTAHNVPLVYAQAHAIMESFGTVTKKLQSKYDPCLVSNALVRISHSHIPGGCDCKICSLGKR